MKTRFDLVRQVPHLTAFYSAGICAAGTDLRTRKKKTPVHAFCAH